MHEILIGGERRGVTFTVHQNTWNDGKGSQLCEAAASFCMDAVSGECSTVLADSMLRTFVADLEEMTRELHGAATLWGGNPGGPNARAELKMEKAGNIGVDASFSDWQHEGVGFQTKIQFAMDQSFLPPLVRAARSALCVFQ